MTTNKQNAKLVDKLKAKVEQLEAECKGLERKREEDRGLDRKVCASYRKEIDSLLNKIKELERDKHINEIKEQAIEEFINYGYELANSGNYPFTLSDNFIFNEYKKKLRNGNE